MGAPLTHAFGFFNPAWYILYIIDLVFFNQK